MLRLCPITQQKAKEFVARHHRHNKPPLGCVFAVSCVDETGAVRGVAIAGRPIARGNQDGVTCEITRCCTDGSRNACSLLYGACANAAKALGYQRIITYTLEAEPGSSLRAAGFMQDALVPETSWASTTRIRFQTDMFGQDSRPVGPKIRWVRWLAAQVAPTKEGA